MKKTLAMMLLSMLLCGCATMARVPSVAGDHTARLIARPDFRQAAQAAPEWTKDALRTITELETQLANK